MKLSITTGIYGDLPLEKALQHLASIGWRHVEFDSAHVKQAANKNGRKRLERIRKLCGQLGVHPWQMHAPRFRNGQKTATKDDLKVACQWLEYGALLGVRHTVFHAIGTSEDITGSAKERIIERNIRAFGLVGRRAEELGIKAVVENMATFTVNRASDIRRIIAGAGSPALGICLDVGHANKAGLNPAAEIRAAGKLLWATHIHDNNGKDDQHLMPYNADLKACPVDWVKVVRALKRAQYRNAFNLEISPEGATRKRSGRALGAGRCVPLFVRDLKLAYAKKLFHGLMSS